MAKPKEKFEQLKDREVSSASVIKLGLQVGWKRQQKRSDSRGEVDIDDVDPMPICQSGGLYWGWLSQC